MDHNFWEDDEFSLSSMTDTIENLEIVPNKIGGMGIFDAEVGVTTTTINVEERNNELHVIPTAARGTMPEYGRDTKRTKRAIPIPHLPKNDTIVADSSQNVRQFGATNQLESVSMQVAQKLLDLKNDHETTWEWHRIKALQGQVLDADGTSIVYDLFDTFGVTETTINWDSTNSDGIRLNLAVGLENHFDQYLYQRSYSGILMLCSPGLWEKLITSTELKEVYKMYQSTKHFQATQTNQMFTHAGITFMQLRGKIGTVPFVPDDQGRALPLGVSGMYKQYNAPGTFEETVNTLGRPYYARQEKMRFGIGREIHTQSNPIFICKYPKNLVKITFSG